MHSQHFDIRVVRAAARRSSIAGSQAAWLTAAFEKYHNCVRSQLEPDSLMTKVKGPAESESLRSQANAETALARAELKNAILQIPELSFSSLKEESRRLYNTRQPKWKKTTAILTYISALTLAGLGFAELMGLPVSEVWLYIIAGGILAGHLGSHLSVAYADRWEYVSPIGPPDAVLEKVKND